MVETAEVMMPRRVLVAAIIFLVAASMIALTATDPGLTWDETIYFGTAARYADWFRNLSAASFAKRAVFETWWQADHPPLAKLWMAASFAFFGGVGLAAARIGAGILFGATAATLYLWVSGRHGDRGGVMAATAFVLMPRLFAHGHFANIEMAMLLLWLLTTIAFERGIRSRRWSIACGVLFGLALLTKINAVFLPIVLVPWGVFFHGRKAIRNCVCMALLGAIVFFGGWPVMWHHPVRATQAYLANKITRGVVETHYLGKTYAATNPPWHYALVMLLATTPVLVLGAAGCGVARAVRRLRRARRESAHEGLILWSCAFPVLLLGLPGVPKYDGIRLMLTAYPFLAVLAAWGAAWLWDRVAAWLRRPEPARSVFAGLAAVWLLVPVVMFHPFQLSYYGELVGGPWGARKLGFETTYWHETFDREALDYLNGRVRPGGQVALVGVEYRVWEMYQKVLGEVRPDILHGNFSDGGWEYLVVVMRQGKLGPDIREFMASHEPVWVRGIPPFGTPPVCLIYRRE